MKSSIRLTLVLLTAALLAMGASGCHTIHGAGRDIEETGQHIEHAAR